MIRLEKRWYQEAAIESVFQYVQQKPHGSPLIALPTGCHAAGQKVMMLDGTFKAVENVKIGDLLMGPDSKPKTVLSLCRGSQEMRRITPTKGNSWVVNKDHILSLYRTCAKANSIYPSAHASWTNETVEEYENASKWHKHIHKLYRAEFIEFPISKKPIYIDPYFLGVYLGDGSYTKSALTITSMNDEILDYCKVYLSSLGDKYDIQGKLNNKAVSLIATTETTSRMIRPQITFLIEDLGLRGKTSADKFIPHEYKTANREDRLAVLAGLLDTDGSLTCNGYDYISKSELLANDVAFIVRSLGAAAYITKCTKSAQNGFTGEYYRVGISGDLSDLPLLLAYKKSAKRTQIKNVLVTGFTVEQLPEDDYYGFELDGDHLYLLDDFTVTHNTGKGIVIGEFIRRVMSHAPRTRVMMCTHVAELIKQNAAKLLEIWPLAPLGIYSASLKMRDMGMPISFVGVQSVYKKAEIFGWIDILVIDEAHLLAPGDASMYQTLIGKLRAINPSLTIIGLTATAYRMGQGMLTDGDGIFTDICFDMTDIKGFNRLVSEGFLCPLYPKSTEAKLDVSKVGINNGEFNKGELEKAVDTDKLTRACLTEICYFGADRECWMIFAAGISHAEHIAKMLREEFNVSAAAIHSKNSNAQNDEFIEAFKSGHMRCAVNMNKLTTGFDHAPIDLIAHMRPTLSTGLWVQMNGRGTRPSIHTGKRDCLALDFARNTQRLGPINDPKIPKKKGAGGGDAPVRICPQCNVYNPASARVCFCCNYEFTFKEKLVATSSTEELIRSDAPVIETFPVKRVLYGLHQKKITNPDGTISYKSPCMKVTYLVGLTPYCEWIHLDASGLAGHKSREWWRQRHAYDPPTPQTCAPFPSATQAALSVASQLKVPKYIRVWTNRPLPEIQSVEY